MSNNGTDRDIALQIAGLFHDVSELVATVNDNKYVPHITTQPTDFEGAIGTAATFSVVANNVKSYQWQYRINTSWSNSSASGNATSTMSIAITEDRYAQRYRCKITGLNNSVIHTDEVKMVAPTPEEP